MSDPNENKIGFENLPNVYFKRVRTRIPSTPIFNNSVVVSGLLTIFEGENAKYWSDDPYFYNFLRIRLRAFREVTEAASVVAAGGTIEEVAPEQLIYGPFEENRPISFRMDVPKDKLNGLYISANLEMDIDSISGTSFNWTENQWYRGPTTDERIFDGQNKVLTMYRFVNGDNVHFGPVHIHMAAGFFPITMKGSFHIDPTTGERRSPHSFLQKDESFNYKNYYVEDTFGDFSIERNFSFDSVPAAYLTNFSSNQESLSLHAFISDSNLSVRTRVGQRLRQINPEYFQEIDNKTQISAIYIGRTKITRLPFGGETSVTNQNILSSNWPGDSVQKNYEYEPGTIYQDPTSAPVKSEIKKQPFRINQDVSLYSIIDHDVSPFIQEHFKYDIRIEYTSLLDEMLKNKILEMQECMSQIQSSFNTFYNNSHFYDHQHQLMSPEGFKEINKEHGYGVLDNNNQIEYSSADDNSDLQKQAYWTKAPQLYGDLIRFLKRSSDIRPDYITLFNLLNPISASPETMGTAIIRIIELINIIRQEYDIVPEGSSNSNSSLPSSSDGIYAYTRSSDQITTHDAYLSGVPQYDYLGQDDGREIFSGVLKERIDTELAEFMDGLSIIDPSQYPSYSDQQVSQLLSPNGSYSFLTPQQMIFQGNNINMTSLDTSEVDKVRAAKIATENFNGVNVSLPMMNIQSRKSTTNDPNDVREYVGDNSFFARGIDDFLDSFIIAPPEITKTISNIYSNKGTNVSLSSIRAFNVSSKMLPAPVKSALLRDFGDLDPFENLETRDAFFNKYFNIVQISYLFSFPKIDNLYNLNNPIYKPLTREKLNEGGYLICKSEPINVLSLVNSSYEEIERKNIKNRVFIVKGDDIL
jgi:hypothetical protein